MFASRLSGYKSLGQNLHKASIVCRARHVSLRLLKTQQYSHHSTSNRQYTLDFATLVAILGTTAGIITVTSETSRRWNNNFADAESEQEILKRSSVVEVKPEVEPHTDFKSHGGISAESFTELEVVCNKPLSKEHNILRLRLANRQGELDYPIGAIVELRALTKCVHEIFPFGKFVSGFYVPLSYQWKKGHFDIIYKVYDRAYMEETLLEPEAGMSAHLSTLKPRDRLDVRGPFRELQEFPVPKAEERCNYGMIAGGTGLTPMIQIIRNVLDKSNNVHISLIVSSKSEQDVFYEKELQKLRKRFPEKLEISRTLTRSHSPTWSGDIGRISRDMLRAYLPDHVDAVIVCGPDEFVTHVVGEKLARNNPNILEVNPVSKVGGILENLDLSGTKVYVL